MQTQMRFMVLVFFVLFSAVTGAADIWYEDNNMGKGGGMPSDFVEKFQQQDSFKVASTYIDVYMVRARVLAAMTDDFLVNVFNDYLVKNNIKLALDAGGANWMGLSAREAVFNDEIILLKRLARMGIRVDYISLQSVLTKAPKVKGKKIDYPLNTRIKDVVVYSKAVRAIYPQVKIGIIDDMPSHNKDYRLPYRMLKEAMAEGGVELSYIHLDISFDIPREQRNGVTWENLKKAESYVENDLGVQFGYFTTSRKGGHSSSKAYHERVMAALECYAGHGGTPAEYIVASWFPHPEKTIPENATGNDYPAMRTVKEFGRELNAIEMAGPSWSAQRSSRPDWRRLCGNH
ncbi:MAG: hypothetical protein KJ850_00390 [Gammaproteobacteria bacterium]|nr:hypothetical protein [Gammaproteobacteria bacterium]